MKRFVSIIGTRPQLVKYIKLENNKLIWTGQHYDKLLKDVFLKGLNIKPDYNLKATELGEMIDGITPILKKEEPDYVIVYGDCRSTLAGALSAYYLNIPIIHIEAGCRSHNENMVEERIRKAVDDLARIHFAPSKIAKELLENEGKSNVFNVGATQIDAMFSTFPTKKPKDAYKYRIMTLHRDFNLNKLSLNVIFSCLGDSNMKVELYAHPHLLECLKRFKTKLPKCVILKKPLPYKQMINRMAFAEKVITDSGGLQVEAFILKRPCMTLRPDTEWIETVDQGWNRLVNLNDIGKNINQVWYGKGEWDVYGIARSKEEIKLILQNL